MKNFSHLKNVATLSFDAGKCTGCRTCLTVCPHQVFRMNGRTAQIDRRDACMECGACEKNCPAGALTVQAGVGCAAAVINQMLGRTDDCCCGPQTKPGEPGAGCCC